MNNIQHLETQYLKAKIAYYEGSPIMSDSAFDVLEQELKAAGSKVIEQVGSKRKDFDFPHPTKMLSLAKIQTESTSSGTNYREDEFQKWYQKRKAKLGRATILLSSPKFDGNAINIIYKGTQLTNILTRGNGISGKDISKRFSKVVPRELILLGLDINPDDVTEIRCEVVINTKIFNEKYSEKFANPRNYVAGVIGVDDEDEEKVSELSIIPLHYIVNGKHVDQLHFSRNVLYCRDYNTAFLPENYVEMIKSYEKLRETFEYQLDGVVISYAPQLREFFGENEHDPEWSIAIKFVPEEVVTPIIGIEWNVGKTGELVPVLKLKPVTLAGTVVKRTSGYNAGYIKDNELGEGTFVSMQKSGDIIPCIKAIVAKSWRPFDLPETCPSCSSELSFDGIHLMCNNRTCKGRIAQILEAGARIIDLKGIAGKTLEPFAEEFENIYDLFTWVLRHAKFDMTGNIEKYGIKSGSRSHEIFINAFKNIKSLTYAQVILMLGFENVGKKLAEQVAKDYCGLEPNYASMEKALVEMFKDSDVRSYIESAVSDLESLGVIVNKYNKDINLTQKDMKTIYCCLTGSPKNFGWSTKEEFISQFENVEEVSVTDKRCNYLITDSYESTSNKMKTAEKKGVKIVTYEDFKI